MPVYEFECEKLHKWQAGLKIDERDTEQTCVACGATGKRIFSPPGIEFKSKGFYTTDNRKIGK